MSTQPAPNNALLEARGWVPGLLLVGGLAAIAIVVGENPQVKETLHVSSLLIVILLGMALKSLWSPPPAFGSGIKLAQRPILRWGVAGLGFKLSLGELASYGWGVLVTVVVSTLVALFAGIWLGRLFGLKEKLTLLLSTGGAICGASAIVAADSVVQGEESDTAYSLGIITLLGTIGIVLYPLIAQGLAMTDFAYGVWNGATLHEMAQVVAAGASVSKEATVVATAVKLARICLLAPLVFGLGWYLRRAVGSSGQAKVPLVPWFLVLFVVFAGVNSFMAIPKETAALIQRVDLWLLCIGMAGVGLHAGFKDLRKAGLRPIAVGALQWLILAGVAFGLTVLLCPTR
ncbi:MAG TPA: YeiH family protein [Fimbriimonadaceae bacterium]|nr:YeiH family protein [Fimbriimonadaceae bacterium]